MTHGFQAPASAILISTEVRIEAALEPVWAILTDFAQYGTWNRYMYRVDGVAVAGAALVARTRDLTSGREMDHAVRVAALGPHRMHWVGGADDLATFRGDHFFELKAIAPGDTLFRHYEYFSGTQATALLDRYAASIRANFETFNECLRAYAEVSQGPPSACLI